MLSTFFTNQYFQMVLNTNMLSLLVIIFFNGKKKGFIYFFFFNCSLFNISHSLDFREVNKQTLYAAKWPQTCFCLEIKNNVQNMRAGWDFLPFLKNKTEQTKKNKTKTQKRVFNVLSFSFLEFFFIIWKQLCTLRPIPYYPGIHELVLEETSNANYETTVFSEAHRLQLSKLNHWMLSEFKRKDSFCSHWTFLFYFLLTNFWSGKQRFLVVHFSLTLMGII